VPLSPRRLRGGRRPRHSHCAVDRCNLGHETLRQKDEKNERERERYIYIYTLLAVERPHRPLKFYYFYWVRKGKDHLPTIIFQGANCQYLRVYVLHNRFFLDHNELGHWSPLHVPNRQTSLVPSELGLVPYIFWEKNHAIFPLTNS